MQNKFHKNKTPSCLKYDIIIISQFEYNIPSANYTKTNITTKQFVMQLVDWDKK